MWSYSSLETVYPNQGCFHCNTIFSRVIQTKEKAVEKYKVFTLPNPATPTEHVCSVL